MSHETKNDAVNLKKGRETSETPATNLLPSPLSMSRTCYPEDLEGKDILRTWNAGHQKYYQESSYSPSINMSLYFLF